MKYMDGELDIHTQPTGRLQSWGPLYSVITSEAKSKENRVAKPTFAARGWTG